MLLSGDLGLAESYLNGNWETPDLSALLKVGAINLEALSDALESSWLSRLQGRLRHAMRANTGAVADGTLPRITTLEMRSTSLGWIQR